MTLPCYIKQGKVIKIKVVPLRFPRQPEMVLFQFAGAMNPSMEAS